MTLTEEKALLACFANAAGEMLNIHDLKAAYEQSIRVVEDDNLPDASPSALFCPINNSENRNEPMVPALDSRVGFA